VAANGARLVWLLLATVLAVRLFTMAAYPVMDTTEARYAEIARHMLDSGDWLMPQIEQGVPFWGKPPLFAWLTAASFKLFGLSEFAARLPHFLLGLATLWLVALAGRRELAPGSGWLPALILASTPLFFVASGAVMTESGLLLATTLGMLGFWFCTQRNEPAWGWIFFAGLGLGMLAKGPVAPVLTLLPLFMWLLITRRWRSLRRLPWLSGSLLALVVCLPWYLLAERHSPGFLAYFLVGEHLLRFIQPGWMGDLYGNAHREPPGMIWLLWFQATAAWGLLFVFALARQARRARRKESGPPVARDPWRSYLLCWVIAPLLFFTFSGNILWTYVITGLPALALLLSGNGQSRPWVLLSFSLLVPLSSLLYLALSGPVGIRFTSERELVRAYHEREPIGDRRLYYLNHLPESTSFYTAGQAGILTGATRDLPEAGIWLGVHKTRGDPSAWGCRLVVQPRTGLFDLYLCHE
jgi:4-amino-4-deoxy-L-arabinose transferase-like glycosyltransferase